MGKRCSIIVQSVTGNSFIIGNEIKKALEKRDVEVRFYRVEDADLHIAANDSELTNEYYEDILALPVITNDKLVKADMIIIGCPTYFDNVPAETKLFLDNTVELYAQESLKDKLFAAFSTCGGDARDALATINCLERWAELMKMQRVALPLLYHSSGDEGSVRPGIELEKTIEEWADAISVSLS